MPGMSMIFRLIAGPPKKIQLLLFSEMSLCVCKQISEVMYQQEVSVVRRPFPRIPYTSLYGWRNKIKSRTLYRLS